MASSIYSTRIRRLYVASNKIALMTFNSVLSSGRKTQETPVKKRLDMCKGV